VNRSFGGESTAGVSQRGDVDGGSWDVIGIDSGAEGIATLGSFNNVRRSRKLAAKILPTVETKSDLRPLLGRLRLGSGETGS
jgi:hypothetical protein